MKNDVVLFLVMISLMKIMDASTEVIFNHSREKIELLKVGKLNHNRENNIYKDYKRNLEYSKSFNKTLSESNYKNKLFNKENLICNKKNCNIPYGECINEKVCKCIEPYANLEIFINNNINSVNNSNLYCRYKMKSQIIAFILEIIFIAGIGHFYMMRIFHGLLKLLLVFILSLIYFIIKKNNSEVKFYSGENNSTKNLLLNISMVLLISGLLAFQIYDLIMIGSNLYLDGYGIPLISWNKGLVDSFLFDPKDKDFNN